MCLVYDVKYKIFEVVFFNYEIWDILSYWWNVVFFELELSIVRECLRNLFIFFSVLRSCKWYFFFDIFNVFVKIDLNVYFGLMWIFIKIILSGIMWSDCYYYFNVIVVW